MTVTINITHEFAGGALAELRELSAGLLGSTAAPVGFVNAKDFGAIGDGVTDDTAAVQAAVNAVAPKPRRGRPPKAPEPVATVPETAMPEILAAIEEQKAAAPAISATPEDRVNPDDVGAEGAEEADGIEDMGDEPAPGAKLTVDDLRNAAGRINRALGNNPARAQELAGPAFVEHGVKSISTCPDDKLEVMVSALNAMAAKVESGEVK